MKRKGLLVFVLMFAVLGINIQHLNAQRMAYVDSEYILSRMDEYKAAQDEMNQLSAQWQREYEEMVKKVEDLYKKYQSEKVLLSEDLRLRREQEIELEEKKNAEYRKKRFGIDGDLFRQREEKVKPIMDKMFAAVEATAKEKKFDIVVDKSSTLLFLYANPTFNLSDAVLRRLGITPGAAPAAGTNDISAPAVPGARITPTTPPPAPKPTTTTPPTTPTTTPAARPPVRR